MLLLRAQFKSPVRTPSHVNKVVDFWFGKDLARLADDKEYAQSYGAKWFGAGPPDESFVGTQNASKELIEKAARYVRGCVYTRDGDGFRPQHRNMSVLGQKLKIPFVVGVIAPPPRWTDVRLAFVFVFIGRREPRNSDHGEPKRRVMI